MRDRVNGLSVDFNNAIDGRLQRAVIESNLEQAPTELNQLLAAALGNPSGSPEGNVAKRYSGVANGQTVRAVKAG